MLFAHATSIISLETLRCSSLRILIVYTVVVVFIVAVVNVDVSIFRLISISYVQALSLEK